MDILDWCHVDPRFQFFFLLKYDGGIIINMHTPWITLRIFLFNSVHFFWLPEISRFRLLPSPVPIVSASFCIIVCNVTIYHCRHVYHSCIFLFLSSPFLYKSLPNSIDLSPSFSLKIQPNKPLKPPQPPSSTLFFHLIKRSDKIITIICLN